jgi:nucleoside-diphosphate-sugar epimerase
MPVPESAAHNAANVYGQSKAEAEDIITKHLNEVAKDGSKKVNAIFLRFSNVYGSAADHRERLIPAIMTNALAQRPIQIVGGDQEVSFFM